MPNIYLTYVWIASTKLGLRLITEDSLRDGTAGDLVRELGGFFGPAVEAEG
jgi:hypothetical protein